MSNVAAAITHVSDSFGIALRTRFIDELLIEALSSADLATVVSVGSGLDTRPWRLNLPPDLRWIEIDFPAVLDYKDELLAAETPRCRRERLPVDLNDPAQRAGAYAAVGRAPALMLTEGLLMAMRMPRGLVRARSAGRIWRRCQSARER